MRKVSLTLGMLLCLQVLYSHFAVGQSQTLSQTPAFTQSQSFACNQEGERLARNGDQTLSLRSVESGRDYPPRPARTGRSKQLHRVPRQLARPHGDRADLRPPRQRGHTPLLRRIIIRPTGLFQQPPTKTQRDTVAAGDGLATRSARVSWGLLWCSITNGYRDCAWA